VCNRDEKRGVNMEPSPSQVLEMNFLRVVELEDVNLLGRRYTWYHLNGISMSRIDRLFVSEEWLCVWGDVSLWGLPRDVSNHCPFVLTLGGCGWGWGPKLFRFNNYWLQNRSLKGFVEGV
jgi:hypothetical protein